MAGPMGAQHQKAMMMSKGPPPLHNMGSMGMPMPMQAWGPAPGVGHLPGELSPSGHNGGLKLPPIHRQPSMVPPAGMSIDDQLAYMDAAAYAGGGSPMDGRQQQGPPPPPMQHPQEEDLPPRAGGYAHVQSKIGQGGMDVSG